MFCAIHRLWLSACLDDGVRLNRWQQRHIQRCPRCRQYLESNRQLIDRLVQDQPVSSEAFHQALADGAMRRIEATAAQPPVPEKSAFERLRPVLAAAALIMILLGSIGMIHILQARHNRPGLDTVYQTCRSVLTDDILGVFALTPETVKQTSDLTTPYTRETSALYADIRGAWNHVLTSIPLYQPNRQEQP